MDNATRLQYLDAMGIDVWVFRNNAKVESKPAVEEAKHQHLPDLIKDKLTALQKEVAECQKCALCSTRTQTVFGEGDINADWMFIGEAPGQNEDMEGKPFVGQAGLLLTEMIRAIGLKRESVYITNILKCRPPNNRDPKVEEANSCRNYLYRQIAIVQPKIILAVGRIAAQTLLETNEPLSRLRGVPHSVEDIPMVVVYHPAYLLRSLQDKSKAWLDLQLAIKIYQEL